MQFYVIWKMAVCNSCNYIHNYEGKLLQIHVLNFTSIQRTLLYFSYVIIKRSTYIIVYIVNECF